jgi:hypothetical protein
MKMRWKIMVFRMPEYAQNELEFRESNNNNSETRGWEIKDIYQYEDRTIFIMFKKG